MTDTDSAPEQEGEYIVEKIIKKRVRQGRVSEVQNINKLTPIDLNKQI